MERLVDRARLATAAQFYDKNEKAGLIEIKPIGESKIRTPKATKAGIRPKPENIPPWSQDLIEKHAGKVKETLTLIRQGKDEAEIFVGNNTKERNGKELITGMLQEHLQKLNKVSLKRTSSQATELLDSKPQKTAVEEVQRSAKEGQTMNHTEEIQGRRYQAMPDVDVRTVRVEKLEPGTMREILVQANLGHEGLSSYCLSAM